MRFPFIAWLRVDADRTLFGREVLAMSLEIFSEDIEKKVASHHLRNIISSARKVLRCAVYSALSLRPC